MDKLKIFVSSKTTELHSERKGIKNELSSFDVFEIFMFEDNAGARTESPHTVFLQEVSNCDLYVGIFREEYSEATQQEYEKAFSLGKEILIYVSDYNIINQNSQLSDLLKIIRDRHSIQKYTDVDELKNFLVRDISSLLVRKFKQLKDGAVMPHNVFGDQNLVKQYLTAITPSNPDSLKEINQVASEIMSVWNAMGYTIKHCKINNNTIDFEGEITNWLVNSKVFVRCVDGEISIEDVKHVKQFIDDKTDYNGFVFTHSRILQSARDFALPYGRLKVQTQGEFYRGLINPDKYIESLRSKYESSDIPRFYVGLNCFKEIITEGETNYKTEDLGDLEAYVDKWLDDRSMKHLSILGEFGSGKTWFARRYAMKCVKAYLDNPNRNRIPIFISLRDYAKSYSIKQLMTHLLINEYGFKLSSFNVFEELNKQGKFILIFDGFDEMAQKVDYDVVVDNFWELASVAVSNSKVLLTCRTTHFRYERESQLVLSGRENKLTKSLVTNQPGFEIINLRDFSEDDIIEVMTLRIGNRDDAIRYWADLKRIYDVPSIARKPVLTPMLIEVMTQIVENTSIDAATIYRIYTERWIRKSHEEGRTYLKTKWETLFFMTGLAWFMIKSGNLKIHWKDIPIFINDYFKVDSKELDYYAYDLRTNTFLKRDNEGVFEFTHKSMTEFFVAYKFALELGAAKGDYTKDISLENTQQKPISELITTFGHAPVNNEIMLFLKDIIGNKQIIKDLFIKNKQNNADSSFLSSNLITLLLLMKESFDSADISKANLPNAELENARFTNCNFDDGNLSKSNMSRIVLTGSTFNNSNLAGSILNNSICNHITAENIFLSNCNCNFSDFHDSILLSADVSHSKFVKSNLSSIDFQNLLARSTDFTNSKLENSVFDDAMIDNCTFDESDLTNTSFKNAQLTNCTFHDSITQGIELTNCNLSNSILEHLDLRKVKMGRALLVNAVLLGSNLSGSRFTKANLTKCNMQKTDLTNSLFEEVDFTNAMLQCADLSYSKLIGCNLVNANLEHIVSYLLDVDENTKTKGAVIDQKTFLELPSSFQKILIRDNPEFSKFLEKQPAKLRK